MVTIVKPVQLHYCYHQNGHLYVTSIRQLVYVSNENYVSLRNIDCPACISGVC